MSRSVSVPYNAVVVAYSNFEGDEWDWEDDLENLKGALKDKYPSLYESNKWVGREDHVVLENGLVYIGISEYCGLISVWVLPKDGMEALGRNWALGIEDFLKNAVAEAYNGCLVKMGVFSNGEAVFMPWAGKKSEGSLGVFSSKEGWL